MQKEKVNLVLSSNNGPASLRDTLRQESRKAVGATIYVAFVTEEGIRSLLPYLRRVATKGSIRLLTGLYQGFTTPEALRMLLDVQRQTRGRFSVHLSRNPRFHRKLYILRGKHSSLLVVGSSNLTADGTTSNGETNMYVGLSNSSKSLRNILKELKSEWDHDTLSLTEDRISAYEKARRKFTGGSFVSRKFLKELLGIDKTVMSEDTDKQYWWNYLSGYVVKRTTDIVEEYTGWGRLDWFADPDGRLYSRGDLMFIAEFSNRRNRRFELVKVVDVAETPKRTPDGKYFVAYKVMRNFDKKLNKRILVKLAEVGVNAGRLRTTRPLSEEEAEALRAIFKQRE